MPRRPAKPKPFFEQLELGLDLDGKKALEPESPPRVTHHFVGWDRPVLESAVDFLTADWNRCGALDLSSQLVITPTRHSGRRLREALAIRAAKHGAAVLPPTVVTPLFITDPARLEILERPVADPGTMLAVWTAALLSLDLHRYRHLFPVDPVERNLSWGVKVAGDLLEVRDLLCREGHRYASAGLVLAENGIESGRWADLKRLEREIVGRTEEAGYTDPVEASHEAAGIAAVPAEVTGVTLIGCADLARLTTETLERIARRTPVDIVIAAPAERRAWFDGWGNPRPEAWLEAEIDLPAPEERIRAAANPAEQAELAARLLEDHEDPAAAAAVGVPDPETIAPVVQVLSSRGWSTHDPSGKALRQHPVHYLLQQTHRMVGNESFDAFRKLARVPDWLGAMMRSIEAKTGESHSQTGFLQRLDEMAAEVLPDDLGDAEAAATGRFRKHPELEQGIAWARAWVDRFRGGDFGDTLIEYLVEVFETRVFAEEDGSRFPEVSSHLMPAADLIRESERIFARPLNAAAKFEFLLELVGEKRLYPERRASDIDLEGWAELLWEDAPHLVITGMNDSRVPESVVSHSYLPDSARKLLGMTDNDRRFARDAYLLTVFVESRRRTGGRVDFLFGRQSVSGDPLRPSRLLFQCAEERLAERTLQFFSGETRHREPMPWKLAWKLRPRRLPEDCPIFERLTVTSLKHYLACPFRFYLRHGLGMEEYEAGKTEMNAMEFGNLVHDALEAFGRDEGAAALTEAKEIAAFFHEEIDRILSLRYGRDWSTPVLVQREAARHRLGWWAEIEAEERRKGWRIVDPEATIGTAEAPFQIEGMTIRGRIDRIERHPQFGIRVFDFKTFSPKDRGVMQFHIESIKRNEGCEDFPAWSLVEPLEGAPGRWVDLQLPLYRLAVEERFPDEEIRAGYVTLGQTEKEVKIDIWEDLDEQYLESARNCAVGVIAAIREHRFWPPAEKVPYPDALDDLFFGDVHEAVDPTSLIPASP